MSVLCCTQVGARICSLHPSRKSALPGGISSLNHLKMLKTLGAESAIVGKTLYTGDIKLKEALAAISH